MAAIVARPTVYKGIRMRSRLEADFAQRFLDGALCTGSATWEYEPQCFASAAGQYLPDFRVVWPGCAADYFEVKPRSFLGERDDDEVDGYLRKMEIIWESEPAADLHLFFWEYGGEGSYIIYSWSSRSRLWLTDTFPSSPSSPMGIWYGLGQFDEFLRARLAGT